MPRTGRCLCGAVRFEIWGEDLWSVHCHCESCRRQTASAFTTFFGVASDAWRWTGVAPSVYVSSPGVERRFCPTCGSPISFEATKFPGETHFYAALLEDQGAVAPTAHVHWEERAPWVSLEDALLKREGAL